MATPRVSPASFLKHAADVSSFYGFRPMREVEKTLRSHDTSGAFERTRGAFSFQSSSVVCSTYASLRPQEPVLAFYATPAPSHPPIITATNPRDIGEFGLHVIGSGESVGEIVLLKTLAMIMSEWGTPVSRIRVNALGDKDSQQRFIREMSLFVRKHADRLDQTKRASILANPLLIFQGAPEDPHRQIAMEGPRPMHFLSEKSRSHFRSILEHLENLGLPYELDDSLVGDDRGQHITFAVDTDTVDATVVSSMGGRYDEYLKRESRQKGSVGVSASIFFRRKGATAASFTQNAVPRKPKIYFAQLGTRAKLQGLSVLDMLRTANVPVLQSFDASRLSSQLAVAQAQGVSHLLIIGQREALDGTIIVRSMKNSAQVTVQLSEIPRFLKTLRV